MAGLATYRPKRVLHTPSHLLQNDASGGGRRVAKAGMYHTRSTSKQRDLQGQQKKSFSTSEIGNTGSVKKGPRFKVVKRRKHDSRAKHVRGRHRITCEACRAYGTLIECDTCTSSWHSQCVRLGTVPDPASPPTYWSCPKCLEKRSRTTKRLPKDLVPPLQGDGEINTGRVAGINFSDNGGPRGTVSGLHEVQQCCLELSAALQQGVEKSQSTIQVLQEALNANTSQIAALELEAHRRSRELEEVKKEKERVTAELNQIKTENSESTSRMDGIMKIVEGFFVHRRNV